MFFFFKNLGFYNHEMFFLKNLGVSNPDLTLIYMDQLR